MNTKPHTFVELFDLTLENGKSIGSIEVPMIQRDYAQGRRTIGINRIRKKFLAVLHGALTGDSYSVRLDFVYGDVTDGKLIPLDGQQRLTTLFLIHWYIAKKENVPPEQYAFLRNFTYRTRPSSARFCEKLLEVAPDFKHDTISDWLADQSWYLLSWEHDPTIASMLTMLDDIHATFKDESNLWDRITASDNPPISFFFLALDDMGLTDSLYIKMNSRGKPLTEFEHFKADFEGMLKGVSESLCNEFIHKVDKDWLDMLWSYRGDDDAIDDEFVRYFRFVSEMLCFKNGVEIDDDIFDLAQTLYSRQSSNVEANLQFLFSAFDCWCQIDDIEGFFSSIFSEQGYEDNKVALYSDNTNILLECYNKYGIRSGRRREFTLNNSILLYAVLTYQLNKETISAIEFRERMRIVRNLVMNSEFEIRAERMNSILKDTEEIICDGRITLKNMAFNEIQKNQEIEKADWRIANPDSVNDLNRLEDHPLLQGTVAIIGMNDPQKLAGRVDKFYEVFDQDSDYIKISRALLTIGDYSQDHGWRFLLGDRNDASWRELFSESKQRKHFDRTRQAVLSLLDCLIANPDESLDSIIESYLEQSDVKMDWRYYLIKYPRMRAANHGRYCRRDEEPYNLIMMNTASSLNGRHWSPYLYQVIEEKIIEENCSLGEYGDPLVVLPRQIKVRGLNDAWLFTDMEDNEIRREPVPQSEDGFDTEDRVELLITHVQQLLQEKQTADAVQPE